jgi:SAM-dependent methyltransferase
LSTLKLAARVRLTDADRVLDLGCGIGGSARVLAEVYRCSVHGVDANRQRIQDATSLGALVRAPDGVTYQCADFLTLEVEPIYSVVWGQNSWIHCGDREQLAAVARSSLLASGRLAFEDVCVRDSSKSAIEARSFGQLCQLWYSEIVTFDQWAWAFRRADFAIKTIEDDGNGMLTYFENLMAVARAWPGLYPEREVEGWRLALELTRSGVLGYFRAVGVTAD